MTPSCLIIGAGMAGLTAAAVLQEKGWAVLLVDKGRAAGGRLATRRIGGSRFDHGAQFFTVRDGRFREAVAIWESDNVIVPWFTENGHVRYRAAAGMNGLAKHLAKPFEVRTETRIQRVEPGHDGWCAVSDASESFHANALLLTAPAPQSIAVLDGCADGLPAGIVPALQSVAFDPCFALLVTLEGPSRIPAPGYLRLDQGRVEWIADNTQKGVSTGPAALTIHARADFSRHYLNAPQEDVARLLLEAAEPWFGADVAGWQLHRWRYSKPIHAERPPCLFAVQPAPLAIAGDAFGGSRLEGAFLSGLAAAAMISTAAL